MIISSPLKLFKFNQHSKSPSPPPSPTQPKHRPLVIASSACTSQEPAAKTASSTFSSSVLPPHLTSSSAAAATSFYEVLGVPMGASSDEIKAAYRKLARVCHPDVAAKDASADEFMRIHTAYSTLSDPVKRADYDRRVFPGHRSFTTLRTKASPASVYTRRKWETDQCW